MVSIVVIEGLVCAGKTTLLSNIRQSIDCLIIPEYINCLEGSEQFPRFPPFSREEVLFNSQFFIMLERRRQYDFARFPQQNGLFIFDRGIMSCLAFDYAARGYTGFDTYLEVINMYQKENFSQPHLCLYLDITYELMVERMKQRGTFKGDHFADKRFSELLVEFYRHFFGLPQLVRIDAKLSKEEILKQALVAIGNTYVEGVPMRVLEIAQGII